MIIVAPIPLTWFTDESSKRCCELLGERVIKVKDWIKASDLLTNYFLPDDFKLSDYLTGDQLAAVFFEYEGTNDVLIHPDRLFKISKKALDRKSRLPSPRRKPTKH